MEDNTKLPPPWVLIFLGGFFIYMAYEHYVEMSQFEAGVIDQVMMWTMTALLYDVAGFWPTVIIPFIFAGAMTLLGVWLQCRDLALRFSGKTPTTEYEPVRWKAVLLALALFIAAFVGILLIVIEK